MPMSTLQIKIDEDLKWNFKLCAMKNKENMTDILIKRIEEYVEEFEE